MQWGGVLGLVSRRPARRRHRADGRLLLAAHPARAASASSRWRSRVPLVRRSGWPPPTASVRERVGDVLGAVAESVVGAPTVRAYGVARPDGGPHRRAPSTGTTARRSTPRRRPRRCSSPASSSPPSPTPPSSSSACCSASAGTIYRRQAGRLPVPGHAVRRAGADRPARCSTRRRTRVAGFRRVLDVVDTEPDVGRPGAPTRRHARCRPGPLGVRFDSVIVPLRRRRNRAALDDVDLTSGPRRRVADRRRDRLGQDDVRQAGDPADGPDRAARVLVGGGAAGRGAVRLAARRGW